MKKYVVISICILAICAVFGLSARTDYDNMKIAIEHVNATSGMLVDDLQTLHLISYVVENFDASAIMNITATVKPETSTTPEEYYIIYQTLKLDDDGMIVSESKKFDYSDPETMGKVYSILKPLSWNREIPIGDENMWGSVLDALRTVVFILCVIISIIMFIIWFVLDSVLTAWALVQASIFVLGFPVMLI